MNELSNDTVSDENGTPVLEVAPCGCIQWEAKPGDVIKLVGYRAGLTDGQRIRTVWTWQRAAAVYKPPKFKGRMFLLRNGKRYVVDTINTLDDAS